MAYTILSICNLALGEVPHKSIASLAEHSLAAAKCTEHYPQARDELLEVHGWEFLARRQPLAAVDNDRRSEWAFAYALPSDLAYPRRILAPEDGAAAAAFGTVGQRPAPVRAPWQGDPGLIPYAIAGSVLFTDQPHAVLDYSRAEISEARFTPAFARALALDLAARLVLPLIKSRARQSDLIRAAEVQKQRAIALDANRVPRGEADYVSEAARARGVW